MYTYLISYDLRAPGKNYSDLHNHLKSYYSWAKPLESFWLIRTTESKPAEVRNAIRKHMDTNDHVFVVDVTGQNAAWYGMSDKVTEWIKENL